MVKNENNNFYDTVYQVDEYQSVFLKVPAENFLRFSGLASKNIRVWYQDLTGTPTFFRFKFFFRYFIEKLFKKCLILNNH